MGCMNSSDKTSINMQKNMRTEKKCNQQTSITIPKNNDIFHQDMKEFAIQSKIILKSPNRKSKVLHEIDNSANLLHPQATKQNDSGKNSQNVDHQKSKTNIKEPLHNKQNNLNIQNKIQPKKNLKEGKENYSQNKQNILAKNKQSQIQQNKSLSSVVKKPKNQQKVIAVPKKHCLYQENIPLPVVMQLSQQYIQSAIWRSSNKIKMMNAQHFPKPSIKQEEIVEIKNSLKSKQKHKIN